MDKERKEQLKEEAIARMRLLRLMPKIIGEFKRSNRVYYSERQNAMFNAVLYWLDNKPEWVEFVKDFENKNNCLVYHCQLTYTEFGDMLSLLYVDNDETEWELEKEAIANGQTLAYVHNLSDTDLSEYGMIGVKPSMGGITRTW